MSLVTVPAVLLRSYPYSESSLILRFLTPEHGVVSALAKGVRRRSSRGETPMETFQQGSLTFQYREERDLHGFRDFQSPVSSRPLAGDLLRFSGASFLAELVLTHTMQEANSRLFNHLVGLLDRIGTGSREKLPGVILSGAWTLLLDFGFPPSVAECLHCGRELPGDGPGGGIGRFDVEGGGIRCAACAQGGEGPRIGPEAQVDLRKLISGIPPETLRGASAHLSLVERYALFHLAGRRPFHATSLLRTSFGQLGTEDGGGGEGEIGPVEEEESSPERKPDA
jgi:DNA repair protein RecO (recombination protein O)